MQRWGSCRTSMPSFLVLVGMVVNNPIMMSLITTLFGLAPLVFIPGEGTELYRGVGVVVLSGLLFATLVTLTFLPALLVTVLRLTVRYRS